MAKLYIRHEFLISSSIDLRVEVVGEIERGQSCVRRLVGSG